MSTRKSSSAEKGVLSQRQLKVGEEIRHILSSYMIRGDFYNPELNGYGISITEVRISPDMSNALVFVYPLGGKDIDKMVVLLNTYKKSIRYYLAQKLTLKITPDITFKADMSFENSKKINKLLNLPEVLKDTKKPAQETSED